MDNNLKNLLISELNTSNGYLERVLHALIFIAKISHHHKVREICEKFHFDLQAFFEDTVLKDTFQNSQEIPISAKIIREHLGHTNKLVEALIHLNLNQDNTIKAVVEYINLQYKFAHKLHLFSKNMTDLEILYPRANLIEDTLPENDELSIALFQLPVETVLKFSEIKNSEIVSLSWQRDKKYELFLQKGHDAVFRKELDKALEIFTKATNYKETAEIYTLIAWVNSLLGNNEKAKSGCLKAIQIDADYGPPYNDLGTYLLAEGQVEEALKWFSLAKKASNYQNREYPYINSGRAYMAKKDFNRAFEEFSRALTLAPYHEDLHNTVKKLKESIEKGIDSTPTNTTNFTPVF